MQKMNEKDAIFVLKRTEAHGPLPIKAKELAIQALEEIQQYRAIGTIEELRADKAQMMLKKYGSFSEMIDAVAAYSVIGTVEKCSEAVERMKAMSTNESIITIGLYFKIHDADIYGGKGTIGYANTNVELKVSALAKADISNYVEMQRQGVAEMLKVDKEKVIIISKSDYEDETADEEDWEELYGEINKKE